MSFTISKNARTSFVFLATLAVLTLFASPARAASMTKMVGAATVTLTFSPDPPTAGRDRATVVVTGVPVETLRATRVRFATVMPSMGMNGAAGAARMIAPGRWTFEVAFGMAASWNVALQFTGRLAGSADFPVQVAAAHVSGTPQASMPSGSNMNGSGGTSGMNGMAGMSSGSGDSSAWKTAVFVLVALGLIALIVLRRDRRTSTIGLFALAAVVVLAIATAKALYAPPPMDMNAMANVAGTAPVAVTTTRARLGSGAHSIIAPGTVAPYLTQAVVARASGMLTGFNLYNGDRVRAGQQIAYLSEPELGSSAAAAQAAAQTAGIAAGQQAPLGVTMAQQDLAVARNQLAAARADASAKGSRARYWANEVARERTLLAAGAVSQQEYQDEAAQQAEAQAAYDAARKQIASSQSTISSMQAKVGNASAGVAAAQAQYAQAQSQAQMQSTLAAYRSVIAADDAVIVKRLVDPGTYVQAGTPIAQIAVLDKLRVQAGVAQSDLPKVNVGDPIEAVTPDGTVMHGRVSSIQPVADPATHTAMVEAIVENPQDRLQPGGYVRVTIHSRAGTLQGGAAISATAIVGAMASSVYVVKGGTAQLVQVRVISNDGVTAIVRGLPENAHVVVDGAADLQPGQAVTEVGS